MFVNISNHPSAQWESLQFEEACRCGEVVDYSFPQISPFMDEMELSILADKVVSDVTSLVACDYKHTVLHIMGEMTLTYMLVARFSQLGYRCVASTTERTAEIYPDGTKISHFKFIRFREYQA